MQVGGCHTSSTFYPARNINFQKYHFEYVLFMFRDLTKTTKNLFLVPLQKYYFWYYQYNNSLKKKNIKVVKEKILL